MKTSMVLPHRICGALTREKPALSRTIRRSATRSLSNTPYRSQDAAAVSQRSPRNNTAAANDLAELDGESESIPGPSEEQIATYASRLKRRKLVPSRYHFRSPRYYRGPLHPHQPPPKASPASREYVPGPFSLPRLMETHQSVIAPDLMTLFYQHLPPGVTMPEPAPRLRGWDDSSPYFKNRPLRGPRGRSHLPLIRKMVTFRNVPTMEKITISTLLREGSKSSDTTHVAGMILQAISNKQATVHMAKRSAPHGNRAKFVQKEGKPIAAIVELQGEAMWHFLSTFLTVVLPKIKDWSGVKARSGDRSGNYGIGIRPDVVGLWPEIAVNYDAYPTHMIPYLAIHLQTSAKSDRDGRMLLSALGVPFVNGGNK